MKTLIKISSLLVFTSVVFMACQKETSFEQGSSTASVGSLSVDASGNCLGAVVSGTYFRDTAIKTSNYVDIGVQVDTVGTYVVSSDTVNGYYFKATGSFTNTGAQTVKMIGGGKPLAAGSNIFTVKYNGTFCEFTVTVTAAAGGGSSAFTITCTGATPVGTYVAGTALTAANTITLNVNVTNVGSWSVSTAPAVNGITFSGTGTFSLAGAQTIVLTGSGTPTAAGTNTYTVTGGTGTCTFQCTVTASAPPDYFPRTTNSNWSYSESDGVNTYASLYKVIPQTKTVGSNVYNTFMYTYDAGQSFDTLGYYRKSGSDYFEWNDMRYYVPINNAYWMEINFLKDNQPAGSTWTSSQFSGSITDQSGATTNYTIRFDYTILQQNVTVTVGSTSYANTIKVKQEIKILQGANWVTAFYLENYYAKDKGLIKQYWFDNAGATQYTQDVTSLQIF